MAVKAFEVSGLGLVYVYKRRGAKSLRLSVTADGQIRVTIPNWAPYRSGIEFARNKQGWLLEHQRANREVFRHGQRVGKHHTLNMTGEATDRIRTRLLATEAALYYPRQLNPADAEVQNVARKLTGRALKQEAEQLLPQRLDILAATYNLPYASFSARHLKTRWGSCSSKHELTFNYFLMELPWELIDYVIAHELAHTKHLNHSRQFWELVGQLMPDYQQRRKDLKQYRPNLRSSVA
jgi:predicted metal-dependent hydrolase